MRKPSIVSLWSRALPLILAATLALWASAAAADPVGTVTGLPLPRYANLAAKQYHVDETYPLVPLEPVVPVVPVLLPLSIAPASGASSRRARDATASTTDPDER